MYHPLWREDGSVVYTYCWSSPAKSFSEPSPAGLMTTFYWLRFETPPIWRARSSYLYPPGAVWPSFTPRHCVPFSSPPTTRRATVEVFEPASSLYSLGSDPQKTRFPNNSSVVMEVCLLRRCIETAVLRLWLAYSLRRECVYRVVAYQWTSTLTLLFRLSGVMSQY
jgi:hypothetical protein